MNKKISKDIYIELINGKYINKNILSQKSNIYSYNNLFKEIEINLNEYEELFENIGYKLIKKENYIYLTYLEENNEEIDKNNFKEYILILIIIKFVLTNNFGIETMTDLNKGLEQKYIDDILNIEEYKNLLYIAEISTMQKPFNEILIKRNILELNNKDNFIFSDIAKDIMKKIIKETKEAEEND